MATISVLGAGSWGTALALRAAYNTDKVILWGRNASAIGDIETHRLNKKYLPDIALPSSIHATTDLQAALHQADGVIVAVPTEGVMACLQAMAACHLDVPILLASKGFDREHLQPWETTVQQFFTKLPPPAVLGGPSFAKEVGRNLPTAVIVAHEDIKTATFWQKILHHGHFRVYVAQDPVSVSLGGALKNVYAIASGISDGLQFGANARAALVCRSFAEILKFVDVFKCTFPPLMGLAGLGDLMLTSTDDLSRNRRFGLYLGKGHTKEMAIREIGQAIEGLFNLETAYQIAQNHQLDTPILSGVYEVVNGMIAPKKVVEQLFSRPVKTEFQLPTSFEDFH